MTINYGVSETTQFNGAKKIHANYMYSEILKCLSYFHEKDRHSIYRKFTVCLRSKTLNAQETAFCCGF